MQLHRCCSTGGGVLLKGKSHATTWVLQRGGRCVEDILIGPMLQQGHLAKHNVVCLLRQLVLDGAVFGAPQQKLVH